MPKSPSLDPSRTGSAHLLIKNNEHNKLVMLNCYDAFVKRTSSNVIPIDKILLDIH